MYKYTNHVQIKFYLKIRRIEILKITKIGILIKNYHFLIKYKNIYSLNYANVTTIVHNLSLGWR